MKLKTYIDPHADDDYELVGYTSRIDDHEKAYTQSFAEYKRQERLKKLNIIDGQ